MSGSAPTDDSTDGSTHGSTRVYREILAVPGVRRLLAFAVVGRMPHAATSVVITLHVVLGLDRGYGAAGVVGALWTVGAAIGSPWRGRLLDRVGLRRTVLPSLLVEGGCWVAVPFLSYGWLLPVALLGGLMSVPTFTVVRQALAAQLPSRLHSGGFTLDSIATELTYMIAPAVGVVLATTWSTRGALMVVGVVTVLAGLALIVLNPPLTSDETLIGQGEGPDRAAPARADDASPAPVGRLRQVFTPGMVTVLLASTAAVAVLAGTEVSIVAHLQEEVGDTRGSWLVFAVWSITSLTGGLLLGAMRRPLPVFVLLLALGLTTAPMGLVPGYWWLVLVMVPAGFFCAPTLSATAAEVNRLVPEAVRGEAMGWYGTATTVGMAVGAPLAGFAIDRSGAWAGFALIGTLGALVAGAGLVLISWGNDRPGPQGSGAQSGVSPTRRRAASV